jgi:anti-sigma factor ChrR (cupin superfamily)
MEINADFSLPVTVHAAHLPWTPSPMAGVDRKMLDRIGGEVARATSIVCYAPGSHFRPHVHEGGEEFLVLEGVFEDEHGVYPAGTYVRNPRGTRHTPGSTPGCTLFVKLWQFDPTDTHQLSVDIAGVDALAHPGQQGGTVRELHSDARERVTVEQLPPGSRVCVSAEGGLELLILAGDMTTAGAERLEQYSWLRLPAGTAARATAGDDGVRFWLKTGHLRFARDYLQTG